MQILNTRQHEEWTGVLGRTGQHDFYHLPAYHRLAEDRGEGTAHLFAYRDGDCTIALPLLLRPVEESGGGAWSDATSVYGYAGPLASPGVPESIVRDFQEALKEALAERRVVALFSRLHPLIPQSGLLAGLGECRPDGETVSIDLTLPPEAQWAQFRSSHRTRINKLRREGVLCLRDGEQRHLGDFVSIYHETMRRVNAHGSYFFDADYFARLASGLGPKLQLFVVTIGGRVAGGAVVTICDGIVQYHLGGTSDDFLNFSPMPLLVDTVRLWANEQGARAVHLGGGVGAKTDSLLHFKTGFSDRRHDFTTWRWIVDPPAYQALCERKARWNQSRGLLPTTPTFFPEYRAPASVAHAGTKDGAKAEPEKGIAVFGVGGHAEVVISTIIASGHSLAGLFDDDEEKWGRLAHGRRVTAPTASGATPVVIAIGDNAQRMKVAGDWQFAWETVVHPAAYVDPTASLGAGTVVFAGAVIQPGATIGRHVIVNTGATIDHDCVVGDFAHIAPGAHLAGSVKVGAGVLMGIGSVALPGVKIGDWTTVGAGAVVTRDLSGGGVAYGVPAKIKEI